MVILEAPEELLGGCLFLRPHPCVDLGHIDGAAGEKMTLLHQPEEKLPAVALIIQSINDDAGVEKVGRHLSPEAAMQSLIALFAQLFHPTGGTDLELRMVFVLPGAGNILQGSDLLQTSKFLLRRLSEKLAAPAFTNQSVDFCNEGLRNDDVGAPCAHIQIPLNVNRLWDLIQDQATVAVRLLDKCQNELSFREGWLDRRANRLFQRAGNRHVSDKGAERASRRVKVFDDRLSQR